MLEAVPVNAVQRIIVSIASAGTVLAGNDVPRLPLGPLGLKGGLDLGRDVVLGSGGTEAADRS